ncbi:hypothetical protein [Novosphingobium sp. B 225]|uniref:hypothetical protein n=1 Tax=Novosphingobium sp. B 225 TaxID=1961849 RepID=UPI000B4B34B9|nr:hypothetical protein [Novosphingobium sp. B 225]
MIKRLISGALALCCVLAQAPARADDPHDPTMRSPAARARDRAIIRQLNLRELAKVRARDARWARENTQRRTEHDAAMERYHRDMARWRQAVARCRAGEYRYCDG